MPPLLNFGIMREPLNWLIVGAATFVAFAILSLLVPEQPA